MLGTTQARIVRESVKAWFDVSGKKVIPSEYLDTAWAHARRLLASFNIRIISSIMPDMINILFVAKWTPYSINLWIDPRGAHWQLDLSVALPSSIVAAAAIVRDIHNNQLDGAYKHHNGNGIKLGIE